jgi:aminoglycoside phosphotransferase (APT) family kinase protein
MIDRQTIFSGTEPPPSHLQFDAQALGRYLLDKLEGLGTRFQISKFKGGQSNPTYKLSGATRMYVLRRRPPGVLLSSAHAIDREYRVIGALHRAGFPVPAPRLYCTDESIIGSEFYVVDYCDGRVFWNADLPNVSPRDREIIYDEMNALLARLHAFDFGQLGLSDFGRSGAYAARNLARWSKVYLASQLADIPDMNWLIDNLPARLPTAERTAVLHGDFGLYNLIVHSTRPRIVAVLDWEMSTLGDPLVDLAHNVRAWWEIPDPGGNATSLAGRDLGALGIPPMDAYIERYCQRVGLTTFPDRAFYLGYAQFRYAAMIQGILKRASEGTNANRTVLQSQSQVIAIARMARATLE